MKNEPYKELILHGTTYIVYRDGTIIGPSGKKLKHQVDKDGYLYFGVSVGSRFFVHRAVALCFVHNPHGYKEVDHLDGNRANPSADNLEWVTHGMNVHRAALKGSYSGERNSQAKLNQYIVSFIREACSMGFSYKYLAHLFKVKECTIKDIKRRRTWKHIA